MQTIHPATRIIIVFVGLILALAIAAATVSNHGQSDAQSAIQQPTATADGRQGRKRRMRERVGKQEAIEASGPHDATEDDSNDYGDANSEVNMAEAMFDDSDNTDDEIH